jgi:hypothetical protein
MTPFPTPSRALVVVAPEQFALARWLCPNRAKEDSDNVRRC